MKKPTLFELVFSFFILGLTTYSMAMLEELKQLNSKKKWLSDEEIDKGLAMVQLYPGPIFIDLAIYIAYKLRGIIGAILATIGIFYPSFFYTILMSEIYEKIKHLSFIQKILKSLLASFTGMIFLWL